VVVVVAAAVMVAAVRGSNDGCHAYTQQVWTKTAGTGKDGKEGKHY
jgi:hypothetical protein